MRRFFLGLYAAIFSTVALANDGDPALRRSLDASDLVVLGRFVSEPERKAFEPGDICYTARFSVERYLKPDSQKPPGDSGEFGVAIERIERTAQDRPPELKMNGRCILFLSRIRGEYGYPHERISYVSSDPWFAVHPPTPSVARELWRLCHDADEFYVEPRVDEEDSQDYPLSKHEAEHPGKDVSDQHVHPSELEGRWRMLSPSGSESKVVLTRLKGDTYRLTAGHSDFNGLYETRGNRLVRVKSTTNTDYEHAFIGNGRISHTADDFEWVIPSPHLLSLVKQHRYSVLNDSAGTILFRSTDETPETVNTFDDSPAP